MGIFQTKCWCLSGHKQSQKSLIKLIDLNDDCLIRIFENLDLQNLLNVAIASKWLSPAANNVFRRKFDEETIIINCSLIMLPNGLSTMNFLQCLQIIRHFGSSIKNLDLDLSRSSCKQREYIHQYIIKYCSESSGDIRFDGIFDGSMFLTVEKTVPNVQNAIQAGKQLPILHESFPNFHHLELDKVFFHYVVKFQNRQLQSLYIKSCRDGKQVSMNTLLDIIIDNSAITELYVVWFGVQVSVDLSEVQRLLNEHPSLVKLRLPDYRFTVDGIIAMIGQLKSLKVFEFQVKDSFKYYKLLSKLGTKWTLTEHFECNSKIIQLYRIK